MIGTVKVVNPEKGFGFIKTADGNEYFFHKTGLMGMDIHTMTKGMGVDFDVEQSPKGPRAERVSSR